MTTSDQTVLFTETQRFDQLWARAACVLIFAVCVFVAYEMIDGELHAPPCSRPPVAIFALVIFILFLGMLVTLGMLAGKMQTTLDHQNLRVKMLIVTRIFPLPLITRGQAVTYSPLGEYGGWGFRRKFGDKTTMAYTTSGDRGVMVELNDGRKILVGSKRAEELAAALNQAQGRRLR